MMDIVKHAKCLDKVYGGCMVLHNYLDGAMADMESGDVENTTVIEESIEALRVLGDIAYYEYKNRYDKYMEEPWNTSQSTD